VILLPCAIVKSAVSLLALVALSLTACNTLVTRKDLYSPKKGDGPYTRALDNGTWRRGVKTTVKTAPAPAAATTTVVTPADETAVVP
jgi:uncharacterized lipoprotein NlpE involved in copper resistance